jgi:hypothetical protein
MEQGHSMSQEKKRRRQPAKKPSTR